MYKHFNISHQIEKDEVVLRRVIGSKKDQYFLDKKMVTYVYRQNKNAFSIAIKFEAISGLRNKEIVCLNNEMSENLSMIFSMKGFMASQVINDISRFSFCSQLL